MFVGGTDATKQYRSSPLEAVVVRLAAQDENVEIQSLEMCNDILLLVRERASAAFHLNESVVFRTPLGAEDALSVAAHQKVGNASQSVGLTRYLVGYVRMTAHETRLSADDFEVPVVAPFDEELLELASCALVACRAFASARYAAFLGAMPYSALDAEGARRTVFYECRQRVGEGTVNIVAFAYFDARRVENVSRECVAYPFARPFVGTRLYVQDRAALACRGVNVARLGARAACEFTCVVVAEKILGARLDERRYTADGTVQDRREFGDDATRYLVGFFRGGRAYDELALLFYFQDGASAHAVEAFDVARKAEIRRTFTRREEVGHREGVRAAVNTRFFRLLEGHVRVTSPQGKSTRTLVPRT